MIKIIAETHANGFSDSHIVYKETETNDQVKSKFIYRAHFKQPHLTKVLFKVKTRDKIKEQ